MKNILFGAVVIFMMLFLSGCNAGNCCSSNDANNFGQATLPGRWREGSNGSILFNPDGTGVLDHTYTIRWNADNGVLTLSGFSDAHGVAGFGDNWNGTHYYRIINNFAWDGTRLNIWLNRGNARTGLYMLGGNR